MGSLSKRIVPDTILENLTCKLCCKYLTVSPIGVYPDGGNICGRCLYGNKSSPSCLFEFMQEVNLQSVEALIPLVLLGYATYPESLFPCVNRFEGCNKLLPFSSIKNHEKVCVYKKFQCPLCPFQGVGSQMVQHFRTSHKRYISSENSVFTLDLDDGFLETYYLYRKAVTLFLVKVQYIKDISLFTFDTLCLRTSSSTKFGRIRIVLRVPSSGGKTSSYEEYAILSDRLEVLRDNNFNINFKISDLLLTESGRVMFSYNVIYV